MYTECQQYLMDVVLAAGGRQPFTSMKKLKMATDSRVSAVLCESDIVEKDKQKRIYTDQSGRHRRTKKYRREITFTVVLGDYSQEEAEAAYDKLLGTLEDGIYVDGNWVEIEPSRAEWVFTEDSILRAKCAVQLVIKFTGGIYVDTDFAKIGSVSVNAEKRKE